MPSCFTARSMTRLLNMNLFFATLSTLGSRVSLSPGRSLDYYGLQRLLLDYYRAQRDSHGRQWHLSGNLVRAVCPMVPKYNLQPGLGGETSGI